MTCPTCQTDNPSENAYCGKCGAALNAHHSSVPIYASRSTSVRRETIVVLIGILAIFAALAGTYYLFFVPRSPQYAVRRFIEADLAGNLADQSRYVSTRWDSRLFLSTFQTIRQAAGASPFKNYAIADTSERNDSAAVVVRIPLPTPSPANPPPAKPPRGLLPNNSVDVIFQLVRENSEWRIDPAATVASLSGVLLALGINQAPGNLPIPFPGAPGGIAVPPAGPPPSMPQPGTGI